MKKTVTVSRFSFWSAGLNSPGDWDDWAAGKKELAISDENPSLDFSDTEKLALTLKDFTLFKRRLSQITRMTIRVLYDLMPFDKATKIVFVSFRGEINQQFKINRSLINDGELSPAAFSLSVFNAPPAIASIALGLNGGYTAVYPLKERFDTGFQAATAPLLSGREQEIILVYSDEFCPPEYNCHERYVPLAFAALLKAESVGIPVSIDHKSLSSPEDFLKYLYKNKALI